AEGHHRGRVTVHDSHDVRTGSVDFGMNEPLQIDPAPRRVHRLAIQRELEDIAGCHPGRSHVARQEEAVRVMFVTGTHMAEGVQDALVKKDMVGRHQVGYQSPAGRPGFAPGIRPSIRTGSYAVIRKSHQRSLLSRYG